MQKLYMNAKKKSWYQKKWELVCNNNSQTETPITVLLVGVSWLEFKTEFLTEFQDGRMEQLQGGNICMVLEPGWSPVLKGNI